MNLTYILIDLKRQLRDIGNITFIVLMPVVMYLIFGTSMAGSEAMAGNGNIRFYVMASMACYGAALAATQVVGAAGVEQMQGWGRQIGLTPVSNTSVVAMKVTVALIITTFTAAIIYLVGFLSGAHADSFGIWAATFGITVVGATIFALFGYGIALRFKSESALGIATGILVLCSFLGNVFMPLTGTMLTIAQFTPLYGYVALARWPQLEGQLADGSGSDSMFVLFLNAGVWTVVFAAFAITAVRKGRARQ